MEKRENGQRGTAKSRENSKVWKSCFLGRKIGNFYQKLNFVIMSFCTFELLTG